MLSGQRAFQRHSDIETLMAILKEEPPQLERVSGFVTPELADIVGHCLEKSPAERFQSARDLAFALRGADREVHVASSGSRSGVSAERAEAIDASSGGRPVPGSDPSAPARRERRFAPLVLFALIAVSTAGGAVFFWRGRSRPSFGAHAVPARGRRSVAVLGFQNLSGREQDAWLSTALSEMVSAEAAAGGRVRTIEGEDVARMKADLGLAPTSSLSAESLSKIRDRSGADDVIVGSYLFLGSPADGQVRLDVRVQDTRTGETVATITQVGDEPRLFDLVSRVGGTLREGLGEPRLSEEQSAAVRAALPLDPGAARLYVEGLEKLRSYDATSARDLLTKAVEAEPASPLAHTALAQAWSQLGYDQRAVEEAQRAFDLSAGLPREQRLSIEARLAQTQRNGTKPLRFTRLSGTRFRTRPSMACASLKPRLPGVTRERRSRPWTPCANSLTAGRGPAVRPRGGRRRRGSLGLPAPESRRRPRCEQGAATGRANDSGAGANRRGLCDG